MTPQVIAEVAPTNGPPALFLIDTGTDRTRTVTVTWEQHCEGGSQVLNGCIHYDAP